MHGVISAGSPHDTTAVGRRQWNRRFAKSADTLLSPNLFKIQPPTAMKRILLKSKIHRATVTEANLEYEGSVTIDTDLLQAADIVEHERVEIYNISSGTRLATYAIGGEAGSGTICINGAAAHLVSPGDLVIIVSYAEYSVEELGSHVPQLILVDRNNRPVHDAANAN
ncbi:MAG: aspartate 1-decarboxylase [Pirellulaceae bacterium]|jgi:aspartate 1-decarboxylase|nr:aspartate 1-decarboxylase [Pirellulaceae bacterium]